MRASELRNGQMAKIAGVQAGGLKEKLTEMGCIEGDYLKRLYVAPMGDPLAFEINGYTLALRVEEANLIEVEGSSIHES